MNHKPQRVVAQEFMDLDASYYSYEEYHDMLNKLNTINQLLGGDRATLSTLKKLSYQPTSILDVGCGAGYFVHSLAKKFPHARIVGVDIESHIIEYARQTLDIKRKKETHLNNVTFELCKPSSIYKYPKSFDVVMCTLVCHHMTDDQIINFLQQARSIAKKTIIINDLHRHPLAVSSYALIAPVLKNRLITYDGIVSILRSFVRDDWHYYLQAAGFTQHDYTITWHWAFRWMVKVNL